MKNIDKEEYLINSLSSKYIGDDGAVIGDSIYSMDAFFEDVHFKREWMSMAQIGEKAILVNISDAIAMNGKPKFALVTLSLPKDLTTKDIDELTQSLENTANKYNCEIIGGDTVGADKLHLSITIISQSDNPLLRTDLKDGDYLAFTGELGESKKDLNSLFRGEEISSNSRFFKPQLRADFIYKSREFLNSGMDISDGLFCDTNKLLSINNFGFEPMIEISDEIGSSGEEYEMLISFNPKNIKNIKKIAEDTDTKITVFAKVNRDKSRYKCKSHHF